MPVGCAASRLYSRLNGIRIWKKGRTISEFSLIGILKYTVKLKNGEQDFFRATYGGIHSGFQSTHENKDQFIIDESKRDYLFHCISCSFPLAKNCL